MLKKTNARRASLTTLFVLCVAGLALLSQTGLAYGQTDSSCRLVEVASVPISEGGGITVPASAGGVPLTLLVETDAGASVIAAEKADAMNLPRRGLRGTFFTLYGGFKPSEYVSVENLAIGKLSAPEWPFVVVPASHMPSGMDGTLAADLLHSYDVDMDFARGSLRLISQNHCEGKVIYWTKDPVAVVPMTLDKAFRISVPVTLDNVALQAEVDTGTSRSVLSADFASRSFGRQSGAPSTFHSLSFEGVAIGSPNFQLVPDSVSGRDTAAGVPPLIIGRDILSHFHVYIAYGEKRLYLTASSAH